LSSIGAAPLELAGCRAWNHPDRARHTQRFLHAASRSWTPQAAQHQRCWLGAHLRPERRLAGGHLDLHLRAPRISTGAGFFALRLSMALSSTVRRSTPQAHVSSAPPGLIASTSAALPTRSRRMRFLPAPAANRGLAALGLGHGAVCPSRLKPLAGLPGALAIAWPWPQAVDQPSHLFLARSGFEKSPAPGGAALQLG